MPATTCLTEFLNKPSIEGINLIITNSHLNHTCDDYTLEDVSYLYALVNYTLEDVSYLYALVNYYTLEDVSYLYALVIYTLQDVSDLYALVGEIKFID